MIYLLDGVIYLILFLLGTYIMVKGFWGEI